MRSGTSPAHAVVMSSQARFMTTLGVTAALVGLVTWIATMATAPRHLRTGPRHRRVGVLLPRPAPGGSGRWLCLSDPRMAARRPAGTTWPGPLTMDSVPRRQRWAVGPDRPVALPVRVCPDGSRSGRRVHAIPLPTGRPMSSAMPLGPARRTGGMGRRDRSRSLSRATAGATAARGSGSADSVAHAPTPRFS
jgi:hypothetical protein